MRVCGDREYLCGRTWKQRLKYLTLNSHVEPYSNARAAVSARPQRVRHTVQPYTDRYTQHYTTRGYMIVPHLGAQISPRNWLSWHMIVCMSVCVCGSVFAECGCCRESLKVGATYNRAAREILRHDIRRVMKAAPSPGERQGSVKETEGRGHGSLRSGHESLRSGDEDGEGGAVRMTAGGRVPSMVTSLSRMLARRNMSMEDCLDELLTLHRRGELSCEKYKAKLSDLGCTQKEIDELLPQLYDASSDDIDREHKNLHAMHVHPILDGLRAQQLDTQRCLVESNHIQEVNATIEGVTCLEPVRSYPIHTWTDVYQILFHCHTYQPLLLPHVFVGLLSSIHPQLFTQLHTALATSSKKACDQALSESLLEGSPLHSFTRDVTRTICNILKDLLSEVDHDHPDHQSQADNTKPSDITHHKEVWWLESDAERAQYELDLAEARKIAKIAYHNAKNLKADPLVRALKCFSNVLIRLGHERAKMIVHRIFFKNLMTYAPVLIGLFQRLQSFVVDQVPQLDTDPSETLEAEDAECAIQSGVCDECKKPIEICALVFESHAMCCVCYLRKAYKMPYKCVALINAKETQFIPSKHQLAHELTIFVNKPGTRKVLLPDKTHAITSTTIQTYSTPLVTPRSVTSPDQVVTSPRRKRTTTIEHFYVQADGDQTFYTPTTSGPTHTVPTTANSRLQEPVSPGRSSVAQSPRDPMQNEMISTQLKSTEEAPRRPTMTKISIVESCEEEFEEPIRAPSYHPAPAGRAKQGGILKHSVIPNPEVVAENVETVQELMEAGTEAASTSADLRRDTSRLQSHSEADILPKATTEMTTEITPDMEAEVETSRHSSERTPPNPTSPQSVEEEREQDVQPESQIVDPDTPAVDSGDSESAAELESEAASAGSPQIATGAGEKREREDIAVTVEMNEPVWREEASLSRGLIPRGAAPRRSSTSIGVVCDEHAEVCDIVIDDTPSRDGITRRRPKGKAVEPVIAEVKPKGLRRRSTDTTGGKKPTIAQSRSLESKPEATRAQGARALASNTFHRGFAERSGIKGRQEGEKRGDIVGDRRGDIASAGMASEQKPETAKNPSSMKPARFMQPNRNSQPSPRMQPSPRAQQSPRRRPGSPLTQAQERPAGSKCVG